MAMTPIKPGLRPAYRTLHNGSNDVAKISIVVPAGEDITVSEYVADQLQRATGAFQDGAAPVESEEVKPDKPARAPKADKKV